VKINAATALVPAGGTVDCRGLTGAQTIAANVNLSSPNVKYIFADGATFTPNAANLGFIGTANGIEIECGGDGGTVFDWSGQSSDGSHPIINFNPATATNTSSIRIHHCTFIGDRIVTSDSGTAAACILMQNKNAAQNNVVIEDNFVQNCGGAGISVINYSNAYIRRNQVTQTSNIGIQWNTNSLTTGLYREIEIADNVLYDDYTSSKTSAVGAILVGNVGAQTVQGVVVRNNVVKNDIVGGDQTGAALICNLPGLGHFDTSTGCGPSLQVNNATFVSILDNIVENMQKECISFTASDVIVRGNRLNLCGGTVNGNPLTLITTAAAGGILVFATSNPPTTQNVLIDANHIANSGYGVGVQLGLGVTADTDALSGVTISNNVISSTTPLVSQVNVIRGIDIDNRSSSSACGALNTTAASVAANVATLTFASSPMAATYVVGETVVISGFSGADIFFNGTVVLTAVTSTTVKYSLTHGNATATSNGTMNRQCNFTFTDMNIVNNTVYAALTDAYSLQPLTNPTTLIGAPNLSGNLGNLLSASSIANCSSSASPAVCSGAATGSVTIAAGATLVVVDTTAVTAVSQIQIQFDETLGAKLGVTCNTSNASETAGYPVTARTPGTSFTIKASAAPSGTSPACLSYSITN
jgi:hypothetical protein